MSPPACGVCGAPCRPAFRAPAAEQSPELDGRPGEPARSTLSRWVAACRGCGATAPDLSALSPGSAETIRSPDYGTEKSPFLRWAMIAEEAGERDAAAEAILQAAWAADDAGRDAAPLRLRAAALWQGDALRRLDLLRRAGAWDAAAALADALAGLDAERQPILAFQRERIAAGDTGPHLLSSALRPPSRTPHAAHGRLAARPGLLGRLFGR